MVNSSEEQFVALVTQPGTVSESEVEKAFDRLEPIGLDTLKGEWKGFAVDTGHPGVKKNAEIKWAGKTFRSIDDVDPMVVYDEGKRLWKEDIGHARLRDIKYRGKVSAAMIYNNMPIIDHFRRVQDDMVAGAMDTPLMPGSGVFYFYLTKL